MCSARGRKKRDLTCHVAANKQFLQTSFLNGVNAPYIEELQARYEKNPSSVTDEWRHFFREPQGRSKPGRRWWRSAAASRRGPPPLAELQGAQRRLISALAGDYGEQERSLRDRSSGKRTSAVST